MMFSLRKRHSRRSSLPASYYSGFCTKQCRLTWQTALAFMRLRNPKTTLRFWMSRSIRYFHDRFISQTTTYRTHATVSEALLQMQLNLGLQNCTCVLLLCRNQVHTIVLKSCHLGVKALPCWEGTGPGFFSPRVGSGVWSPGVPKTSQFDPRSWVLLWWAPERKVKPWKHDRIQLQLYPGDKIGLYMGNEIINDRFFSCIQIICGANESRQLYSYSTSMICIYTEYTHTGPVKCFWTPHTLLFAF